MILEKLRSCLWKLELGFWTYGLIHLLGPSAPNAVSSPQTLRSWILVGFHNIIYSSYNFGEHEALFVKMKLRFWTCFIRLLGLSGPNVVSKSQTTRSRNILRFSNFVGFILWFWRKWGYVMKNGPRVLDLWLDMSFGTKFL